MTEFGDRNRRVIAERTGWPEGAAEECERLEREHPGYSVSWSREWKIGDPVFHRDEGFYAWCTGDDPGHMTYPEPGRQQYVKRPEWHGATAAELEKQLG